jgi:ABC-type sugar transport system ATPase subunit
VDLSADGGELLVIVGPSGSGKSTLLRCIAGLERPDEGRVEVGGRDVTDVPPGRRDVAMVFQDFALYPHLDVHANIAFGLKASGFASRDIDGRVADAVALLELEPTLGRRPSELSGGERQRVALARAIVREPTLYLLDEPLSNLDAELRTTTRAEIRSLQKRLGTTAVYVTHDQVEAMTMGDRVAVLRAGRVEQVAPPTQLYDYPASSFVARFLGNPPMNVFPSSLLLRDSDSSSIGIRPENLRLVPPHEGDIAGRVSMTELLGDIAIVHVRIRDEVLSAKVLREGAPPMGEDVGLAFDVEDLHQFDAEGRAR